MTRKSGSRNVRNCSLRAFPCGAVVKHTKRTFLVAILFRHFSLSCGSLISSLSIRNLFKSWICRLRKWMRCNIFTKSNRQQIEGTHKEPQDRVWCPKCVGKAYNKRSKDQKSRDSKYFLQFCQLNYFISDFLGRNGTNCKNISQQHSCLPTQPFLIYVTEENHLIFYFWLYKKIKRFEKNFFVLLSNS